MHWCIVTWNAPNNGTTAGKSIKISCAWFCGGLQTCHIWLTHSYGLASVGSFPMSSCSWPPLLNVRPSAEQICKTSETWIKTAPRVSHRQAHSLPRLLASSLGSHSLSNGVLLCVGAELRPTCLCKSLSALWPSAGNAHALTARRPVAGLHRPCAELGSAFQHLRVWGSSDCFCV